MQRYVKGFLYGLAVLLSGCATVRQGMVENVIRVTISDEGTYRHKVIKRPQYTNSAAGQVDVVTEHELVEKRDTIPMKTGTSFGFMYTIVTNDQVPTRYPVLWRTSYPRPMINPKTGVSEQNWEFRTYSTANQPHYCGFGFDYDWEMIEGEWVFEVITGDHVARKVFTLVKDAGNE